MTQHDKAQELVQRQRQIASLHRWFCASETDTIRGPAIMSFGEHARLAADADAAADLITAQAEENQRLREALRKIFNCGQSAEPDHWKFRCMAREVARAALARTREG